ncbi:MAG TPA: TolC family protein, partial [Lysobacter sp.]
ELDNRIEAAQAQAEAAQVELARWLAQDEPAATDGQPPVLTELPVAPAVLLSSIDRQAPLLSWQAREAMAEAEVDSAVAEKRPDWSVEVSYGDRERAPDGTPRSDMLMVEVAVGLPLFGRNRQDRGVAGRRAELQAVAAQRDDARRAQLASVRRSLAEWQAAQRQLQRLEREAIPLSRDRSAVALAAYAGGADLQAWLEARRAQIELQLEHARLIGELGRTWSALAYLLPDHEDFQP